MSKMRAVQISRPKGPLEIVERDIHWADPADLKKSPNWSRSWRRTELLPSPEASTVIDGGTIPTV
jgi:hypothetical protein